MTTVAEFIRQLKRFPQGAEIVVDDIVDGGLVPPILRELRGSFDSDPVVVMVMMPSQASAADAMAEASRVKARTAAVKVITEPKRVIEGKIKVQRAPDNVVKMRLKTPPADGAES